MLPSPRSPTWRVREYDAVFVEDLNVAGMVQGDGDARNKQDAAWRQFTQLLERKADLYGTHVVQVEPEETIIRSVVSLFRIDRIRYAIVPVNRYNRPYQGVCVVWRGDSETCPHENRTPRAPCAGKHSNTSELDRHVCQKSKCRYRTASRTTSSD